jgi:hypothetical protein
MFGCTGWLYGYGRPEYGFASFANRKSDFSDCNHPAALGWIAAAYFVVFGVVGAQIVLNLFIGIITGAMEEAKTDHEKERVVEVCVWCSTPSYFRNAWCRSCAQ